MGDDTGQQHKKLNEQLVKFRSFLYMLNAYGKENLGKKDIEIEEIYPTTYRIMDAILGQSTAEQYCFHTSAGFIENEITISCFIKQAEDKKNKTIKRLITTTPGRVTNSFKTEVENGVPDGHLYYFSKEKLDFYSNGFRGGFTRIKADSGEDYKTSGDIEKYNGYYVYKSNQKINYNNIPIETKKEVEENNGNSNT